LQEFTTRYAAPVVGDTIANLPALPAPISHHDVFLAVPNPDLKESLRPELLVTYGQSLISKALKLYLREYAPQQHWHIQASGPVADTFKSLTRVIRMEPAAFFSALRPAAAQEQLVTIAQAAVGGPRRQGEKIPTVRLPWPSSRTVEPEEQLPASYQASWQQAENWASKFLHDFFAAPSQTFTEFEAFHHTLQHLPEHTALHLANSMAVRYANILGLPATLKFLPTAAPAALMAALARPLVRRWRSPICPWWSSPATWRFSTTATHYGIIIRCRICALCCSITTRGAFFASSMGRASSRNWRSFSKPTKL
jgi:2-succinyl-5-enolpyruvyl-6-hydroxy-3-cyclohexene-1-carboxylate synthase